MFESLFEECFEYALPMRQSFFHESPGQRRDDKIFDDVYLAKVKERVRTSDGDFTTVGSTDLQEIKEILKHLIKKLDKISGIK